jgi:hypothetical protein
MSVNGRVAQGPVTVRVVVTQTPLGASPTLSYWIGLPGYIFGHVWCEATPPLDRVRGWQIRSL